jgi:hypothetical protein
MNDATDERGFLYVANGQDFVDEALKSLRQLKKVMPDAKVTMISDSAVNSELLDRNIVKDLSDQYSNKVSNIATSPYDRTIFLDTDTYLTSDVSEVFELLDEFDLAVAHNPSRNQWNDDVPKSFPQHNTGVIAFRKNGRSDELFEQWKEIYFSGPTEKDQWDQPAFRKALYRSEVRFTVLTPEYNCRFNYPGQLNGRAKIIHGRLTDIDTPGFEKSFEIENVAEKLNRSDNTRVHYQKRSDIAVRSNNSKKLDKIINSLHRRGLRGSIKRLYERIRDR